MLYTSLMTGEDTTRRDRLAGQRTHLAQERTFLAYIRTSISLILLGVVLIHFFEVGAFVIAGFIAILLGIAGSVFSIVRFRDLYKNTHLF